ncbi:Transglutaminase-like superfamily protein [Saccharicrinis carchari]|uniref:Transglutaminase-like superfamily protein n=1 Tax=Saccharicrinis carchari TaxID=1168039 RepID=A0A521B479_SACCC|nr:transglutaminase-like domain-containing protein [Saccharicrinis carchari]SMO41821.1 Transglutaminase-like superfamily protein [Saccharicrinis carchari]
MFFQAAFFKSVVVLSIVGFIFFVNKYQNGKINWKQADIWLEAGDFTKLREWTAWIKEKNVIHGKIWFKADSLEQIAHRIELDFTLDEAAVDKLLHKQWGSVDATEKKKWEEDRLLEYRYIDGEKRYFKRAVSNLKLLLNRGGLITDSLASFCLEHTRRVMKATKLNGQPVLPQTFSVEFSLRVNTNAVPNGEEIRCWLPFPKESHARQTQVQFVWASEKNYHVSKSANTHRTIYMSARAQKDRETVFRVRFKFTTLAQYFQLSNDKLKAYDENSELYKKYTAEQYPHIVFSNRIKKLSDSIVGNTKIPHEKVRKLYYWIDDNIPWAGALEYGTIPCIPQYVLDHKKGDCGMQTLLFMAMARYQGVPVKWQSGWMMHPRNINLHDWCEVYYQGVGWVPLDNSFGLQNTDNTQLKDFYISGMDAYRLIINDGIGAALEPAKKYLRSEPWDFQRGEVEWAGGNLYFDQWNYSMQVLN